MIPPGGRQLVRLMPLGQVMVRRIPTQQEASHDLLQRRMSFAYGVQAELRAPYLGYSGPRHIPELPMASSSNVREPPPHPHLATASVRLYLCPSPLRGRPPSAFASSNSRSIACRLLLTSGCGRASKNLLVRSRSSPEPRTKGTAVPKFVAIAANILTPDCAAIIADSLERSVGAHVNIFVDSAAFTSATTIGTMTVEQIQNYTVANIQTPVLIVDELVRRKMFRKESRIVYISSERSKMSSATTPMYCATKSAGESLIRCWADAFGGKKERFAFMSGTTANAVLVGLTSTEAMSRRPADVVEKYKQTQIPLQSIPRGGKPEDVADVVGLMRSREARWITGSVVSADAGGFKIC
ncbi:hypothetical protein LTR85_005342 [Meristemomyces frigidus]|nr:hypothetical protein LTR85_005342 [Meristemomyces frigidus]